MATDFPAAERSRCCAAVDNTVYRLGWFFSLTACVRQWRRASVKPVAALQARAWRQTLTLCQMQQQRTFWRTRRRGDFFFFFFFIYLSIRRHRHSAGIEQRSLFAADGGRAFCAALCAARQRVCLTYRAPSRHGAAHWRGASAFSSVLHLRAPWRTYPAAASAAALRCYLWQQRRLQRREA